VPYFPCQRSLIAYQRSWVPKQSYCRVTLLVTRAVAALKIARLSETKIYLKKRHLYIKICSMYCIFVESKDKFVKWNLALGNGSEVYERTGILRNRYVGGQIFWVVVQTTRKLVICSHFLYISCSKCFFLTAVPKYESPYIVPDCNCHIASKPK